MNFSNERVLAYLTGCAERFDPCPTNTAIAEALDIEVGKVAYAIGTLRREGRIIVERKEGSGHRRILIAGTTLATAWAIHTRGTQQGYAAVRNYVRHKNDDPVVDMASIPLPRTTCWRCGARSDAGCGHILPEWQPGVAA